MIEILVIAILFLMAVTMLRINLLCADVERCEQDLHYIKCQLETIHKQDLEMLEVLTDGDLDHVIRIPLKTILLAQERLKAREKIADQITEDITLGFTEEPERKLSKKERFERGLIPSVIEEVSGAPDKI